VQSEIFLAIIKNFFDLLADHKPKIVIDCRISGIENAMNVLSQQDAI